MNQENLLKAVELAGKLKHVFIASADLSGKPHLAAAGGIKQLDEDLVVITDWFCPDTVANVNSNFRIAIVVWDGKTDTGYQLSGEVRLVKDVAMLDGYSMKENQKASPQVQRQLIVEVKQILDFKMALHTDIEE
jgi:uncharacterized protein